MITDFSKWIADAVSFWGHGKKQADLARELYLRGIIPNEDRSKVNKLFKGERTLKANEMLAVSEITGYPIPETAKPPLAVVGYAAAGAEMEFFDDSGLVDEVERPPGIALDAVAVEIRGTSMGTALNGWLAIFRDRRDPPTDDLVGSTCIVGLADGRKMLKTILRQQADGSFLLHSQEGVILDVEIAWAAKVTDFRPRNWKD